MEAGTALLRTSTGKVIKKIITHSYCICFSFGIVMWEIRYKKVPYDDLNFSSLLDLKSAVLNGTRPTTVESDQSDYATLMRACWSANTSCRPAFRDVVVRLEEISEDFV